MIKRYCDRCGDQITPRNEIGGASNRLTADLRNRRGNVMLRVEIVPAKDAAWNDGDFCKYCVLEAINQLDDRYIEKR